MAVTVKLKAQRRLTIPSRAAELAGFLPGDELELKVSQGRVTIVNRSGSRREFDEAFAACHTAAKKAGTDKWTTKQIVDFVEKVRRERREKQQKAS